SRSETFEGWKGRVQVCWNKDIFAKEWKECPSPETTHMFLCGNPDMVKDMTAQFESEGFTQHSRKQPGQIHIEKYW
ncbi:MAG: hypothetical protein KDD25_07735, partial [Bdellovibrionales bacterium]|nr:hypothetical protein [Bdellovibrionales bacterium]